MPNPEANPLAGLTTEELLRRKRPLSKTGNALVPGDVFAEIRRRLQLAEGQAAEIYQLKNWVRAANKFAWAHERTCPRHDADAPCNCGLDFFLSRPRPVVESYEAQIKRLNGEMEGTMKKLAEQAAEIERLKPKHEWTGCRVGGDPAEAGSYEWVRYCKRCGVEDTCEDPLPDCVTDAEMKLAKLPADWEQDSSLETWFPLTAETLKTLESRLRQVAELAMDYLSDLSGSPPANIDLNHAFEQFRRIAEGRG